MRYDVEHVVTSYGENRGDENTRSVISMYVFNLLYTSDLLDTYFNKSFSSCFLQRPHKKLDQDN